MMTAPVPLRFVFLEKYVLSIQATRHTLRTLRSILSLHYMFGVGWRQPGEARRAKTGGANRGRTGGLMNAIHALYQLSYSPTLRTIHGKVYGTRKKTQPFSKTCGILTASILLVNYRGFV